MEIEIKKDTKNKIIEEIKRYFKEQRDEEIGDLAAMLFLDFIIEHIGPEFYNQGIKDSITYMHDKIEDLYSLEIVKK